MLIVSLLCMVACPGQKGPRLYDVCTVITWREARVADVKPRPHSYHSDDFECDVCARKNGVKMTHSSYLVIQATPSKILVSLPGSSLILSFKERFCKVTKGGSALPSLDLISHL